MPIGPVFVSSGAFRKRDLPGMLEEAALAGVRNVELSSSLAHQQDMEEQVRANSSAFTFLVHNYFPPPSEPFVLNLGSRDRETLKRSLDLCAVALRLTAELGAPFYAAHAGFNAAPKVGDLGRPISGGSFQDRQLSYRIFQDSVGELLCQAESLGIGFCVENNVVAHFNLTDEGNPWLLLAEPDEMVAFARSVSSKAFGYLMDVAHLKVSAESLKFDLGEALERLAPWIRGYHLSENDGKTDSNLPFDSSAWFMPWLEKLPAAPVVVEAYNLDPIQLTQCLTALGHEKAMSR